MQIVLMLGFLGTKNGKRSLCAKNTCKFFLNISNSTVGLFCRCTDTEVGVYVCVCVVYGVHVCGAHVCGVYFKASFLCINVEIAFFFLNKGQKSSVEFEILWTTIRLMDTSRPKFCDLDLVKKYPALNKERGRIFVSLTAISVASNLRQSPAWF